MGVNCYAVGAAITLRLKQLLSDAAVNFTGVVTLNASNVQELSKSTHVNEM